MTEEHLPRCVGKKNTRRQKHATYHRNNTYGLHVPTSQDLTEISGVTEKDKKTSRPEEDYEMADPFEVRMRFTSQLQHLNASVTSAQKAAHYALKHREMDEDLHSCILEQLERVSLHFSSFGSLTTNSALIPST